jgi:hypothetical protein
VILMGGDKSRILVKQLTGSDLGWFGAARRSGAALGSQRGITIDGGLLRDLFDASDLETGELHLAVGRVGEEPSARPVRRQQKNWRLVGKKVEGDQLDRLGPGDLFVAHFNVDVEPARVAWQVCYRDSSTYDELEELCGGESSAWFGPDAPAWPSLSRFLAGGEAAPDDDRVDPAPGALLESLRGLGYSLPTAIADLIDNSISAGARNVWVDFQWDCASSTVALRDDGHGMNLAALRQALRVGSCSPRETRAVTDLGRFGLGLKTASFSQARRLTVASRVAGSPVVHRCWDLDEVVAHNAWVLLPSLTAQARQHTESLDGEGSGTLVIWEKLDRLVGAAGRDEKRFLRAVDGVYEHLAMIFHRWIEPDDKDEPQIAITLNGRPVVAWDPFHESLTQTESLPEVAIAGGSAGVLVRGFVLPHHDSFVDTEARDRAAGPNGWYGQQGFYVYRHRRLLVAGGWLGLGTPKPWLREQQTRLARIRLDLPNSMDEEWHIDLKKSDARPPPWARLKLEEYGENVRTRARGRLIRRATPSVPTALGGRPVERAWLPHTRGGRTSYRISTDHPVVKRVLDGAADTSSVKALLQILQETLPVQQIWLTQADRPELAPRPFGDDHEEAFATLHEVYRALRRDLSPTEARNVVRCMEPFNTMPGLVDRLED